ncbi:hypothetical protein, partial [Desulfonatronospira sp. MSAO_Bac3]
MKGRGHLFPGLKRILDQFRLLTMPPTGITLTVTIQGVPKSAWGQSPRHIAFTITNITSAKFRDPAQTYTAR